VLPDAFVVIRLPAVSLEIVAAPIYMVFPEIYKERNRAPVAPRSYTLSAFGIIDAERDPPKYPVAPVAP
jgi:hypothetical protein